jgi:hypothetical protein
MNNKNLNFLELLQELKIFFSNKEKFKKNEWTEELIYQEIKLKEMIANKLRAENRIYQYNMCIYKLLLHKKEIRNKIESILDEIELKIKFLELIEKLFTYLDVLNNVNWIMIDSLIDDIIELKKNLFNIKINTTTNLKLEIFEKLIEELK